MFLVAKPYPSLTLNMKVADNIFQDNLRMSFLVAKPHLRRNRGIGSRQQPVLLVRTPTPLLTQWAIATTPSSQIIIYNTLVIYYIFFFIFFFLFLFLATHIFAKQKNLFLENQSINLIKNSYSQMMPTSSVKLFIKTLVDKTDF